ncbi:MAG: barstar family protein [Dorea sp.]|nr:barstar family protein [Dorea sp.]
MQYQYFVDATKLTDKDASHAYLKEALDLPDYYGGNLDALFDCLSEMNETEIVVENVENAGEYYVRIITIMLGASQENDGLEITIEEECEDEYAEELDK